MTPKVLDTFPNIHQYFSLYKYTHTPQYHTEMALHQCLHNIPTQENMAILFIYAVLYLYCIITLFS